MREFVIHDLIRHDYDSTKTTNLLSDALLVDHVLAPYTSLGVVVRDGALLQERNHQLTPPNLEYDEYAEISQSEPNCVMWDLFLPWCHKIPPERHRRRASVRSDWPLRAEPCPAGSCARPRRSSFRPASSSAASARRTDESSCNNITVIIRRIQ